MFGKHKKPAISAKAPAPESPEAQTVPKEVTFTVPTDSPTIVMGLNGASPYIRSVVPISTQQLAVMHSYLGALISNHWLEMVAPAKDDGSPIEGPQE